MIQRYLGKISGPLLDRIDMHIEVPAVPYQGAARRGAGVSSARDAPAGRTRARRPEARGFYNSRMPSNLLRKRCALDESGERTLEMAVRRMGLSARAHDRILKVARTIADIGDHKSRSPPSISPRRCSTAAWTASIGHKHHAICVSISPSSEANVH